MSSNRAKAYHSLTIGAKNTWDDWHLVPSSRPLVNPPTVKTHYVTVPGKDGVLDLSESLSDRVVYGNRTGTWEFYVINSGQLVFNSDYEEWFQRYTIIMDYLHGKELKLILDDDPAFYYTGRFSVNSWTSNPGNSVIIISYNLGPYKLTTTDQADQWLWDPFNFETGIIRTYNNIKVNGSASVSYLLNTTAETHPIIICSNSGMTVTFDGITHPLRRGQNAVEQITLQNGENLLQFTGNGMVTIKSSGGML